MSIRKVNHIRPNKIQFALIIITLHVISYLSSNIEYQHTSTKCELILYSTQ